MPTPQEQYASKLRGLIRDSQKLEGEALKRALSLLKDAHREILGKISAAKAGSFDRFQLDDIRRAMDGTIADLERGLTRGIADYQKQSFEQAQRGVQEAVRFGLGSTRSLGDISRAQLGIAQDYSAELFRGLTQDLRSRLNQTLRRALLGGQDLTDIVKEIGRSVNRGQTAGITRRALTIARTEILRAASLGQQARLEQMKSAGADVKKRWIHLPEPHPRPTHLAAHGTVVEVEEAFIIPPRMGLGGEELLYPRDPNGSAENTVNCRCRMVPFIPGLSQENLAAAFAQAA